MKMTRDSLSSAIAHSAAVTGFSASLIEKDYYCSLILKRLYEHDFLRNHLIFKGGTLLSKCYLPFFRLSEDLDFSVVNELCLERKDRRKLADFVRGIIPELLADVGFREASAFRGFNESRQYNAIFAYNSLTIPEDTIKFEIGFRGDLMLTPERRPLQTLLRNPFSPQTPPFPEFDALVLSAQEAYSEKVRAALSRTKPAIRDFFDVAAISESGFDLTAPDFVALVARKIAADSGAQIDITKSKQLHLRERIETELQGVLRAGVSFSLEKSWNILETVVEKLLAHSSANV
jgi:predicted nucleotidyltransferase component of viral defense system